MYTFYHSLFVQVPLILSSLIPHILEETLFRRSWSLVQSLTSVYHTLAPLHKIYPQPITGSKPIVRSACLGSQHSRSARCHKMGYDTIYRLIISLPLTCYTLLQTVLRKIFVGPRFRHHSSGLDLCYVSDTNPILIALSRPASDLPHSLYCNPIPSILSHLHTHHPLSTHTYLIFNLRGECAGYIDSKLHPARIHHAPWPDHHPPPMRHLISTLTVMHHFLTSEEYNDEGQRKTPVALVHCKAGKGRTGTLMASYQVTYQGKSALEAMSVYTSKRMGTCVGEGVSIRSQRRYIGYVEQWSNQMQRQYMERKVRVTKISVWGLRGDIEVSLGGYRPSKNSERGVWELAPLWQAKFLGAKNERMLWYPDVVMDTADVCLGVKRWVGKEWLLVCKTRAWFNAVMEEVKGARYSNGTAVDACHPTNAIRHTNKSLKGGLFEIPWEEMDGLKGTCLRGIRAFDKCTVEWEYVDEGKGLDGVKINVCDVGLSSYASDDDVTVVGENETY